MDTIKIKFNDEQMGEIAARVLEKLMLDNGEVREIVRCKDCIAFNSSRKVCMRYGGMASQLDEDDYCSFAERKDE